MYIKHNTMKTEFIYISYIYLCSKLCNIMHIPLLKNAKQQTVLTFFFFLNSVYAGFNL